MWTWWVSRSNSAPVNLSDPNTPVHSSNGRLEVTMIEAALVTLAEDLEQQLRTGRRQRYIAELVDDQQLVGRELALEAKQSLLVPGLDQLVDHRGRGGEADRQALLTGRQPQAESDVRLPSATVADCDRVLAASYVFAASEFQDQCLVE